MTTILKGRNHLSFAPMQQLYNLISTNVTDINLIRAAKPTAKEKQWIYPSTPEANDENYPRIAIMNQDVKFEEYGAGQFSGYERNLSGDVEHIVFTKVAVLPITIGVFCKRKQRHSVTYYDGTTHTIQNTKQSDFLGEKIAKFLEMYRQQYFIPNNMDIKIIGMSRSYDDNDFLIAKNIDCEIVMMDEWEIDLTDPSSTIGIIQNINLTIDVNQTGG